MSSHRFANPTIALGTPAETSVAAFGPVDIRIRGGVAAWIALARMAGGAMALAIYTEEPRRFNQSLIGVIPLRAAP
ncbi:MAG: hypothetical protein AMXMBFR84_09880 [Candidatus Hydrogenedentota bacterium]